MRAGKSASVRVSSAKNPNPMPGSSCVADVTLEDSRRLLNQGNRRVTLEWRCGCGGVCQASGCSRQERVWGLCGPDPAQPGCLRLYSRRVQEWWFVRQRALISFQDGIVRDTVGQGDTRWSRRAALLACQCMLVGGFWAPTRRDLVWKEGG